MLGWAGLGFSDAFWLASQHLQPPPSLKPQPFNPPPPPPTPNLNPTTPPPPPRQTPAPPPFAWAVQRVLGPQPRPVDLAHRAAGHRLLLAAACGPGAAGCVPFGGGGGGLGKGLLGGLFAFCIVLCVCCFCDSEGNNYVVGCCFVVVSFC